MKKIYFIFIFVVSCFTQANTDYSKVIENLSESEKATFNNLPDEIKSRISEQFVSKSLSVSSENESNYNPQDTVLKTDLSLTNVNNDLNKFGYSFFSGIPTTFTPLNDVPVPGDYVLGIGDTLEINFSGQQSGTYTLTINKNGQVYLPEIGNVSAVELTFDEFEKKISDAFKSFYISVTPSVTLKELKFIQVSILGAVKNPGTYLVNPFTTASNLLSFAGGLEEFGSLRNIEIKGSKESTVDMYDLLIKGEKQRLNLRSGDIVFVPSTDNFILVNGEVNRPAFYEYKSGDNVKDLLLFAQNFTRFANRDEYQIKELRGEIIASQIVESSELGVSLDNVLEVFFPRIVTSTQDNVYVLGGVSTSGPFELAEFKTLRDLVDSLKFSNDLYPYFGVIESISDSSLKNEYFPFSLNDLTTLDSLDLKSGSRIFLFNKNNFLNFEEYEVEIPTPIQKIIQGYSVDFNGEFLNNVSVPVYGKASLQDLIEFIGGFAPNADKNRLEIIFPLKEENYLNPDLNFQLESPLMAAVNVPKFNSEVIKVRIGGEVNNPGFYPVLSGTTLNELYEKAGGFRDTASAESVVFFREELKEKESIALEIAKSSLVNSFVDSLANNALTSDRSSFNPQIYGLLEQASAVEPIGRLSGDLAPDSNFSKKLFLQDGDEIIVPQMPQTITVFGEVNNQVTLNFNDNYDLEDYISRAGGFKDSADKKNIFIIRSNGTSVTPNTNIFDINFYTLSPGDTIIVPKDVDRVSGLPLVKVATEILSSIAFSAASLNAIKD